MKKILVIIITISLATTISSCNFIDEKPHSRYTPFISSDFQPILDTLNKYIEEQKVNGEVALIYTGDSIVFHHAFGFKDPQRDHPFLTDDIFRLASMTKPITSVAAMMLYEQGKFDLDDPIELYLPEFSFPQILKKINREDSSFVARPAREKITVKQLFTYTSGLYYGFDNDSLALLFGKNNISEGFEK